MAEARSEDGPEAAETEPEPTLATPPPNTAAVLEVRVRDEGEGPTVR